jgi:spore germination protein KB
MLDNGRISSVQLFLILILLTGATALLYATPGIAALAGPDGWIAAFLTGIYALLVVLVAVLLGKRFPAQVFTECLPNVLGRIPGKLLAAIYTILIIGLIVINLGQGSFFVHLLLLDMTPVIVIDITLVVVAVYGAYLGIECIARQNQFISVIWVLSLFLLSALGVKDLNPGNLRPVLENGLLPLLRSAIFHSSFWGDVFIMLPLLPYLNQKREALETGLFGVGFVMIMAGTATAVNVGVFGSQVTAHLAFPFHALVKYISVASFIERTESLFMLVFISAIMIKLAVFYHIAGIAAASTLGLKSYRLLLVPIGIITVVLREIFFPGFPGLINFLLHLFPVYAAALQFAIPALVLLVAVIRKKKGDIAEESS